MIITAAMLREHDACDGQTALFEATFGASVTLTTETWARAQASGLDVLWCRSLLCAPALAEYEKVSVPALLAALLAQDVV